jgi:ribosomal protein S18 acetylase RimI-like enzyme
MEIREVRPREYGEAGRVTALAYGEFARPGDPEWDEYLAEIADVAGRAGRTLVLVAVEDDRIIGTATLELDATIGDEGTTLEPGTAHLRMLGVDPSARGRGVGRALVDACIERARRRGRHTLTLHTTTMMETAQRLYLSAGFGRDPDRDHVPPDFPLIAFKLPLAEGPPTGS